jgi:hypothetical protein
MMPTWVVLVVPNVSIELLLKLVAALQAAHAQGPEQEGVAGTQDASHTTGSATSATGA